MIARVALCLLLVFASGPAVASTPTAAADAWGLEWCRGAVFYEVFVRSFLDSNGDGVGDLAGLISRLDYLNDGNPATSSDLEVDAIWLMPVFESPSYHGYDVTDYEHINSAYGSDADFQRLLSEAHRRGIRVIVDFVMNHTSDRHPWFRESASSPSSPRRDWYVWRTDDPGWTQPWGAGRTWHRGGDGYYYGLFWGGMPDLNFRTPGVREEMKRIARLWLARGVDGFRLDATRHLIETGPGPGECDAPETHAFLKEFAAEVRRVKPDAVLVGENWTDTPTIAPYFGSTARVAGGDELPMNFDFPLAEAVVEGVRKGDAAGIVRTLDAVKRYYPRGVMDTPFLTNHDMTRVATQLGDDPDRLRVAAAILLTLPGAPFLYYGEEIGLENGPTPGDESKRTPMPWSGGPGGGFTTGTPWFPFAPGRDSSNVERESRDPGSLLAHYRTLIRLRHASRALREGEIQVLSAPGGPALCYQRAVRGERVLVALNLSGRPAQIPLRTFPVRSWEPLLPGTGVAAPRRAAGGVTTLSLPPLASAVWRLR